MGKHLIRVRMLIYDATRTFLEVKQKIIPIVNKDNNTEPKNTMRENFHI